MQLPPTGGGYVQYLNTRGEGSIIVYNALSPLAATSISKAPGVPGLHHWSDVTALVWRNETDRLDRDPRKLRYILHQFVTNSLTTQIVKESLGNDSEALEWPGVPFMMDSQEGRAILGSPNGKSILRLLLHHRKLLGRKTVQRVTYFSQEANGQTFNLLWEIVNEKAADETVALADRRKDNEPSNVTGPLGIHTYQSPQSSTPNTSSH